MTAQEALDELAMQTNKEIVYQGEIVLVANHYVDVLQQVLDCRLNIYDLKELIYLMVDLSKIQLDAIKLSQERNNPHEEGRLRLELQKYIRIRKILEKQLELLNRKEDE